MVNKKTKEQKNKNLRTSLIIFGVILFLILGFMFYMKNLLPAHLMNQGKKYLEMGGEQNYIKALKMFDMAADANTADEAPIYYKALTLSKMPPTYENQKALYEIAQLEDCEEASQLAENILAEMRKSLENAVGSTYVDNVLYEDQLLRWNVTKDNPITYSVSAQSVVPNEYLDTVKTAFKNWQTATNGEIIFQEVTNPKNAKISVVFKDAYAVVNKLDNEVTAVATPTIVADKLSKVDIQIKNIDTNGQKYTTDKLLTLAQHQIGHALGLWGHSANENDIMYYDGDYITEYTYREPISQRDINTLMLVYKMIPDVTDVPLTPEQYQNMFYHNILTTYPGENFEQEIQRMIAQLKYDRQNIVVWVDLAINYAYKKQYPRSNQILDEVLPLVANDFRNQHVILYNLAANYYKMEEYQTAERYLNHAISIQDDLYTQTLESFIEVKLGRDTIAKNKLELLNKQHPDHTEVALKLAEVYTKKSQPEEAKKVIDRLVKENEKALKDRRVQKYRNVKRSFLGSN